jgi:hypothetical protein
MRTSKPLPWSIVLLLVAFALLPGLTFGGGVAAEAGASYTAQLSGDSEVPPRATPAGGDVAIQISPDGQSLTYTVTVHDITNVTMGHIHIGAPGTNGDIVLPLVPAAPPGGGPRTGIIGQGTLTAAQLVGPLQGQPLSSLIAQIDAGTAYVNVHTASGATPAKLVAGDLPPGEIRGQIVRAATPEAMPGGLPLAGGGYAAQQQNRPWWFAVALLGTLGLAGFLLRRRRA